MTTSDWQPSASLNALQARARVYQSIRQFFAERQVLEVEVPVLASSAGTDPLIDLIEARCGAQQTFLQSSPEFFLKRLLAAGSGDIYSLGKAFRNGEVGRRHNPEFTMLEWYRIGWDEHQLMDEVEALLCRLMPLPSVERLSYRQLFQRHLGLDPHMATLSELRALALQHVDIQWEDEQRDTWLDLLMSHVIEPQMGDGLVLLYDFPASQCALARVETDSVGQPVARRFEAYVGGMELANGYWELTDLEEQHRRFVADLERRSGLGLPVNPVDNHFLAALKGGLPDSAGVALGVDRLLMLIQGANTLDEVLAFPFGRV